MTKKREPARRKQDAAGIPAVQIFANNLKVLLDQGAKLEGGLTQEQLAKSMGISLRTLGYLLQAQSAPTLRTVALAAAAFGLEPWQLLIEDFPADVALNPKLRQRVLDTIKRYLEAPAEARGALDEPAKLLPRRLKS